MNIQNLIESNLDILELDEVISGVEASKRAAKALRVATHLINHRYELLQSKVSTKSLRDAEFARAISTSEGKDAKTREANSKADKGYVEARERYEQDEVGVSTIDAYIKLFENAHILYRGLGKEINNG